MAGTHHSVEEARDLLEKLGPEDWKKALLFASTILKDAKLQTTPADLLNEAVLRTVAGQRSWKVGMSGPAHLFGAMKSVLFVWNRAESRRLRTMESLESMRTDADDLDPGYLDADLAGQLKQAAGRLLTGTALTKTSQEVLRGVLAGQGPNEIMRALRIDPKRFKRAVLALSVRIGAPAADEEEVS